MVNYLVDSAETGYGFIQYFVIDCHMQGSKSGLHFPDAYLYDFVPEQASSWQPWQVAAHQSLHPFLGPRAHTFLHHQVFQKESRVLKV